MALFLGDALAVQYFPHLGSEVVVGAWFLDEADPLANNTNEARAEYAMADAFKAALDVLEYEEAHSETLLSFLRAQIIGHWSGMLATRGPRTPSPLLALRYPIGSIAPFDKVP